MPGSLLISSVVIVIASVQHVEQGVRIVHFLRDTVDQALVSGRGYFIIICRRISLLLQELAYQ